jgi:uncharacterized protein (TIGR03067 family)
MITVLRIIGLAVCVTIGTNAFKGEETVQGTWRLSAGEANGMPLSEKQIKDGKLVIKGDRGSATLEGGETVTAVQKLDPTQKIKTIDMKAINGPNKDKTCLGIYELKGDKFRVAFAPPGKPRPTKFSTKPDSGYWVHVWSRVKE